MKSPRIAIVGAGPTGLEAALAAAEHGLAFTLYERGEGVADNVRRFGHVRLFTPWSLSVSPRMRRLLERASRPAPDAAEVAPTAAELHARVLAPLAELPEIQANLRLATRVVAIGREGLTKEQEIGTAERARRPFVLLVADAAGRERIERADVVLDTTGAYDQPNALGDGGIPAPGERELAAEIVRYLPDFAVDREAWAERTTLLVGSGHSAQTAARDLAALAERAPGTRVLWALRESAPPFSPADDDPLPERAALVARARDLARGAAAAVAALPGRRVVALEREDGRIAVTLATAAGERERHVVDRVLSLTGTTGDASLYRQLQFHECYATLGPMKLSAALLGAGASGDCLAQSSHGIDTLVNPEPGFFVLGAKSYGRNATFLMRVGWEQVAEVFDRLTTSRAA